MSEEPTLILLSQNMVEGQQCRTLNKILNFFKINVNDVNHGVLVFSILTLNNLRILFSAFTDFVIVSSYKTANLPIFILFQNVLKNDLATKRKFLKNY